ncbi:hypothetical protein [Emticicia fluvialis]|uniref:hypothetical protein n=1 Tax=Emticicia fluvialis TaxID=2974474 RepID=UPI0021669BFD|nr:hypothetical protein [Emticicia fluvialis]
MKIKRVLFAWLLVIAAKALYSQSTFAEQKAGHIYYVSVPNYMTRTVKLNEVASMQYVNTVKNAFMVVIDDSKEELEMKGIKFGSLREFHDENIINLKGEKNKWTETDPREFEWKGNRFFQSELEVDFKEANEEEVKITYLITYVETKKYYYQILCWSLSSEFDKLLPDFKKIATSIKD